MAESKTKSRTFRRVIKKTPSNKIVLHFVKRKHKKAICGSCGAALKGTGQETPRKHNKRSKSQKRPERPFGGVLCSSCARRTIKLMARSLK